jgi:hypothetical protein
MQTPGFPERADRTEAMIKLQNSEVKKELSSQIKGTQENKMKKNTHTHS